MLFVFISHYSYFEKWRESYPHLVIISKPIRAYFMKYFILFYIYISTDPLNWKIKNCKIYINWLTLVSEIEGTWHWIKFMAKTCTTILLNQKEIPQRTLLFYGLMVDLDVLALMVSYMSMVRVISPFFA